MSKKIIAGILALVCIFAIPIYLLLTSTNPEQTCASICLGQQNGTGYSYENNVCTCKQVTEICGYPGPPGRQMAIEDCRNRCSNFSEGGIIFNESINPPSCNQFCICTKIM